MHKNQNQVLPDHKIGMKNSSLDLDAPDQYVPKS